MKRMKNVLGIVVLIILLFVGCEKDAVEELDKASAETEMPTRIVAGTKMKVLPRTVVDTEVETVAETEEISYGVIQTVEYQIHYDIYDDGTKEETASNCIISYDSAAYHATDEELMAESGHNAEMYMDYYNQVLALVNQIREEAGVQPLSLDATLCEAACMRAVEIDYSGLFSHTRPNDTSALTVLDTYGISYNYAGENLAASYHSPESVVEAWKNSEGHYVNLVNVNYTKMGVGFSEMGINAYSNCWVQLFTN